MGHLTDHEAALIKDAVRRRRTPKTLVEGKWSVSPLNQDPAVVGQAAPQRVLLRDITLRTIEQTPGVWITESQRRHLAEALARAGVSSVQLAWLAVESAYDVKREIAFLKSLNPGVEVSIIGGTSERVNVAVDAGADLYLAYGPIVAEFQTIHGPYARQILRAYRRGEDWRRTIPYPKTEAEYLKRLQDDVAYAKRRGLRAGMFASMLHYATVEEVTNFARAAHEVGADEIGFGDGASGVGPEAWRFIVTLVRREAPNTRINVHPHNAFGLAAASALASIQAGAEMAEVAVNHLCSGAGQADLAEVAAALEVVYGIPTGIDLSRLTALRSLVEDITGVRMAPGKPVTGSDVWTYTEEAIFEEEEYAPVHKAANPALFGNQARYVLGRFSGVSGAWALRAKLADSGLELSDAQMGDLLRRLKEAMEARRRTLNEDELVDLAHDLVRR